MVFIVMLHPYFKKKGAYWECSGLDAPVSSTEDSFVLEAEETIMSAINSQVSRLGVQKL